MAPYKQVLISGYKTGLLEEVVDYLIPDDANTTLRNMYIWREKKRQKLGCEYLDRLKRLIEATTLGNSSASPWTFNVFSAAGLKGLITGATQANPCEITSQAHNLSTGAGITIQNVGGMTELNNSSYTITVTGTNTFTLDGIDSTLFGAYTTGGDWYITAEPNPELQIGTVEIVVGATTLTDNGDGTISGGAATGVINYYTGLTTITGATGAAASTAAFTYYPKLPVMGIWNHEQIAINNEESVIFDTRYAYSEIGANGFEEWIPGTTWNGADDDFFDGVNYYRDSTGRKVFWTTNNYFNAVGTDPIRWTNGATWYTFQPPLSSTRFLYQCLALIPFRNHLLAFNTIESNAESGSGTKNYPQRIRWSALGTPFYQAETPAVNTGNFNADSWNDVVGISIGASYLDIPTAQAITAVGFVRDNLVVFCERSTWQLRHTSNSAAPFIIEKINSELGVESTYSGVQFDTSIKGIGQKGIIDCDSFQTRRIDKKIPDFVYRILNTNAGVARVAGARDYKQRLVYWMYPTEYSGQEGVIYPNERLVYNYDNDSWAIFDDQFTALGTYYLQNARTWSSTDDTWAEANYTWGDRQTNEPLIIGGNQQGYISILDQQTSNDRILSISDITGGLATGTVITSVNHGLQTGQWVSIVNIVNGTGFSSTINNPRSSTITDATQSNPCVITSANHSLSTGDSITISDVLGMTELNDSTYTITVLTANTFSLDGINSIGYGVYTSGGIWQGMTPNKFYVQRMDSDTFSLYYYNTTTNSLLPQVDSAQTYVGGGEIEVRDNFSAVSKKFSFMDVGQNTMFGGLEVIVNGTPAGEFSVIIYQNYNNSVPTNILPGNQLPDAYEADPLFTSVIPTYANNEMEGEKYIRAMYMPIFCAFFTVQYTFTNAQMASFVSEYPVQIEGEILHIRPAGKNITIQG